MSRSPKASAIASWLVLPLALAFAACSSDNGQQNLSRSVGAAFAPCNESEIRFLSAKHNFMTVFRPCGSNNFEAFTWSPKGTHIYFELPLVAHVMDADAPNRATRAVPTPTPVGSAAWLDATRLAVPVGPETEPGPFRVAVYDIDSVRPEPGAAVSGLAWYTLGKVVDPDELTRWKEPYEVLFTAKQGETRGVFRLDLASKEVTQAFPWLEAPVDTFTATPEQDAVVVGRGDTVTLYQASSGEVLGTWTPARRGTLHPGGRWLALEHQGEPQSIYYQRSWDELSEGARQRELARAKRFEDELPDWAPRDIRPPTISVVDRETGLRWRFTSFYGTDFEWYTARDYWASLILWGYESKQLKRNVILGNLAGRLDAIVTGTTMMGVEPFDAPEKGSETTPPPAGGSEPTPSAEAGTPKE